MSLKRNCFILMLLCVMFILLCSCTQQRSSALLRICFDTGSSLDLQGTESIQEHNAMGFLSDLNLYYKDMDIELEIIPSDSSKSTERAAMLQRIRTEIMTGGGPDVFVVRCEGRELDHLSSNRLFPYPEKMISSGVFLPLDEYIPTAKYTVWEDFHTKVMDGGKDQDGHQVVLPMTFGIPINIFSKDSGSASIDSQSSWENIQISNDPTERELLRWLFPRETDFVIRKTCGLPCSGLAFLFPQIVDFQKGEIIFNEDDIFSIVSTWIDAYRELISNSEGIENYTCLPNYYQIVGVTERNSFESHNDNADLTMVPLPDLQGGISAEISMYCAINRNTEHAQEAFQAVDLLVSESYQQNSSIYRSINGMDPNMPTNKMLCAPEKIYHNEAPFSLEFTQQQYDEWVKVCDQVTTVHFRSPLENEIEDMMLEIQRVMEDSYEPDVGGKPEERMRNFVYCEISDEQLREIIHLHYKRMCRLIDES